MIVASDRFPFFFAACSVFPAAMCIISPSEQRVSSSPGALAEVTAYETIGKEIAVDGLKADMQYFAWTEMERKASTAARLLQEIAPTLQDGSEVKRLIDEGVAEALEARLKFFPGLPSVKSLLAWNRSVAGPRMGPVKEPLELRRDGRILSMHDMASGYNEMSDNDYLMLFRSWELVDIFTYFSHVQVAVPPLQWTMVAHQRKRPALGTIMFEGVNGPLEEMQKNKEVVLDQLVNLVDHYGFDGWFFNMESGGNFPNEFYSDLRQRLKNKVGEHALVIAYPFHPSRPIFGHVDGVLVNYNWDESDQTMRKLLKAASGRTMDVYMGLDAFGGRRGNDEPDPEHVSLCAKYNLSMAIFAPGYTLEVAAQKHYSPAAVDFDRRYWSSIGENFGRDVHPGLRSGRAWPVDWASGHNSSLPEMEARAVPEPLEKMLLQLDADGHSVLSYRQ